MEILNFQREKFIRECREYMKTGVISESLRHTVLSSTPDQIQNLIKNFRDTDKEMLGHVLSEIKVISKAEIHSYKNKIDTVCYTAFDSLVTVKPRYEIAYVQKRYDSSINPVRALHFDLEETMSMNRKSLTKHHKILIEKFKDQVALDFYIEAIETDIRTLTEAEAEIKELQSEYMYPSENQNIQRISELIEELHLWKNTLTRFPIWVNEVFEEPKALKPLLKKLFSWYT